MSLMLLPGIAAGLHALVVGFGTPSSSGWPSALDALRRVLPD